MTINTIPAAGALGEIRSRRIPGREDVTEEKSETLRVEIDNTLTIEDIELLSVLLDACAQRGAFKINEFSVVGALHVKLISFLEKHRR